MPSDELKRFRKRLREQNELERKVATTAKDWVSMVVGIIGVLFGATTIYFSNLRKYDDLRLVIDEYPVLHNTGKGWEIEARNNFIFINDGNRTIVVAGIQLQFSQPDRYRDTGGLPGCEDRVVRQLIPYDQKPFEIKPGEALAKETQIVDLLDKTVHGKIKTTYSGPNIVPDEKRAVLCLAVTTIAADQPATTQLVLMNEFRTSSEFIPTGPSQRNVAQTLLHQRWPF
jgi:hypothetical protein